MCGLSGVKFSNSATQCAAATAQHTNAWKLPTLQRVGTQTSTWRQPGNTASSGPPCVFTCSALHHRESYSAIWIFVPTSSLPFTHLCVPTIGCVLDSFLLFQLLLTLALPSISCSSHLWEGRKHKPFTDWEGFPRTGLLCAKSQRFAKDSQSILSTLRSNRIYFRSTSFRWLIQNDTVLWRLQIFL